MDESRTTVPEQGTSNSVPDVATPAPPDETPQRPPLSEEARQPRVVVEVPLNRIARNEKQPRLDFSETELAGLADSIREHGVLQPLLVTRKPLLPGQPEQFEIVAGERRWRASQRAGLATVPVIIHDDLTDREQLELALVENLQRKDLNPIEEGHAYQRLHAEFGLTHEEIARRVGKSRPVISNAIRLLDLPENAKAALVEGKISYGQARGLLAVTDPVQQQEVFEQMLAGKMTSQAVERLRRGRKPRRAHKDADPEMLSYERELSRTLGAPVHIRPVGPGGVIEVDYFSVEELSGILEKLRQERGLG